MEYGIFVTSFGEYTDLASLGEESLQHFLTQFRKAGAPDNWTFNGYAISAFYSVVRNEAGDGFYPLPLIFADRQTREMEADYSAPSVEWVNSERVRLGRFFNMSFAPEAPEKKNTVVNPDTHHVIGTAACSHCGAWNAIVYGIKPANAGKHFRAISGEFALTGQAMWNYVRRHGLDDMVDEEYTCGCR